MASCPECNEPLNPHEFWCSKKDEFEAFLSSACSFSAAERDYIVGCMLFVAQVADEEKTSPEAQALHDRLLKRFVNMEPVE